MAADARQRQENPTCISVDELDTHEDVFRHLHGTDSEPVTIYQLVRERRWVKGYTSKRCATVEAEKMVKV
jgi:hypothetical protein